MKTRFLANLFFNIDSFSKPLLILSAFILLAPAITEAALIRYDFPLEGSQLVPPVTTAGSGNCNVTLDDISGAVDVSCSFSELSSNGVLAHIHGLSPVGVNAEVIVPLIIGGDTSGFLYGNAFLDPGEVTGMIDGLTYVNLHTTEHPAGELRGQVIGEVPPLSLDNNHGLGDAGIFQYYTVNSGWQTFIRVINTSDYAASVKVRFREAANSREVLDFIVFLSPHDVWAGWTDSNATNNGKPGVRTLDTSCLYPMQDTNNTDEGWKTIGGSLLGADFQDRAYTDDYDDNGNVAHTELERMSEGHLEIIGIAAHDPVSAFGRAVTHNHFTGKPSNCSGASDLFEAQAEGGEGFDLPNVLAMNGYLINVSMGQGAGYDPDIIADFQYRSLVPEALATATDPDMDSANSVGAWGPIRGKWKGQTGLFAVNGGVDNVSYQLQRSSVINEWAASANPGNVVSDYFTQWVVTFPTKHYYVDMQNDVEPLDDVSPTLWDPTLWDPTLGNDAHWPFDQEFDEGETAGESCEPYRMRIWNREEESRMFTSPEPRFPVELCNETNVLVFNEDYADKGLNSTFAVTIPSQLLPVDAGGATSQRGWASMDYSSDGGTGIDSAVEDHRLIWDLGGLPVTGFMLSIFNTNDNATNHTTINAHKYLRTELTTRPMYFGDDDFQKVDLPFSFPFNGRSYSSVFVNSNGSLTFGFGDRNFDESVAYFLGGPPRIGPMWSDLNPAAGGSVIYEQGPTSITVTFDSVPEFFNIGANTFMITLRDDGSFTIEYGAISALNGLAGSTEGGGAADPGETDLSAGGPYPKAGTTYELFNSSDVDLSGLTLEFNQ